jgi:hypothetical protein
VIRLQELAGAWDIGTLPVTLTHVRTLRDFEGPLLAQFQSDNGETFLYHWCDRDSDVSRWMVIRTPVQDLARYLVGATTLRNLVTHCPDRFVYLLDLDADDHVHATVFVPVERMTNEYVPTERSYYDVTVVPDDAQQDVFVNDQSPEKVWEIRRKYFQAYDFLALFGRHGDTSELPERQFRYTLRGGWVRYTLFSVLRNYVIDNKRASVAEWAVASPGYVRFQVDPSVASDLRDAVIRYLENREPIDGIAKELHRWRNEQEPMSRSTARNKFQELCELLRVKSANLLEHTDMDTAIETVRSYLNRLAYFVEQEQEGTAMLVGLKRSSALR